jgi:hypothetical protein
MCSTEFILVISWVIHFEHKFDYANVLRNKSSKQYCTRKKCKNCVQKIGYEPETN